MPAPPSGLRHALAALLLPALLGLLALPARAQFTMTPSPLSAGDPVTSEAETADDYRKDAARHLYSTYPMRIFKGRLPPMLYGVAVVETELDAEGKVTSVRLKRPPSAPEVGPWVLQMVRKAGPFPAPSRLGPVRYVDIWLVHRGGSFQLDTLTEGQD